MKLISFLKKEELMPDQRGWKLKVGAVIPSTNTIVQPDFDDLRTPGITNHIGRITLPNMPIKTDKDFDLSLIHI